MALRDATSRPARYLIHVHADPRWGTSSVFDRPEEVVEQPTGDEGCADAERDGARNGDVRGGVLRTRDGGERVDRRAMAVRAHGKDVVPLRGRDHRGDDAADE